MENSKIEWTHHTFNPWIGCTKVSPGCLHCYAETLMDTRYGRVKWGKGQPRSRTAKENWRKPRQWNSAAEGAEERPRVFCASLADWLDYEVKHEWRVDLLNLIAETPNLDWLLLTKRPESWSARLHECAYASPLAAAWINGEAPANVWVGTSAEDQTRWDERIPELMAIPARVRFVSAEPLVGRIHMGELRPDWLIGGTRIMKTTSPNDDAALPPVPGSPVSVLEHHNGRDYLRFQPHGYALPIALPVITHGSRSDANAWTWNGSIETPTLKPSVKTTHANGTISHIWLTDGMCQHLGDSTDGLAGQTLPLLSLANAGAVAPPPQDAQTQPTK